MLAVTKTDELKAVLKTELVPPVTVEEARQTADEVAKLVVQSDADDIAIRRLFNLAKTGQKECESFTKPLKDRLNAWKKQVEATVSEQISLLDSAARTAERKAIAYKSEKERRVREEAERIRQEQAKRLEEERQRREAEAVLLEDACPWETDPEPEQPTTNVVVDIIDTLEVVATPKVAGATESKKPYKWRFKEGGEEEAYRFICQSFENFTEFCEWKQTYINTMARTHKKSFENRLPGIECYQEEGLSNR